MNTTIISDPDKLLWKLSFLILALFVIPLFAINAKDTGLKGLITDIYGKPIEGVTIEHLHGIELSNTNGEFTLPYHKTELGWRIWSPGKKDYIPVEETECYVIATKEKYISKRVRLGTPMVIVLEAKSPEIMVHEIHGSRKEKQITSSISTLQGSQIVRNSVKSFGESLAGRIPGLYIRPSAGSPGNNYIAAIYVRGKHTYTGSNAPLILIDGYERDLSSLTVDEVESVSILKDAASTVLYGMDGANGVVLINTRRGRPGNVSINFRSEFGVDTPIKLPEFYNAYEFASAYNQAQRNDGIEENQLRYSESQLQGYLGHSDPLLYPDVDWVDETIRKYSTSRKYVVNMTGGNQAARFFVNLGYKNAEGIYKEIGKKPYDSNNSLENLNFRTNVDINIGKRLSMKMDLGGYMQNLNSPAMSDQAIWNNLYTFNPNTTTVYAREGVWGGTNIERNNPVAYINDQGYTRTHRRYLQTNLSMNYDLSGFLRGLNIGARTAFDSFYAVENGYSKTYGVMQVTGISSDDSMLAENRYTYSDMYGNNSVLTAFGPRNEVQENFDAYEGYLDYYNTFGSHSITSKLTYHQDNRQGSIASETPEKRMSFSGAFFYDFKNRYLLDLAAQYGATENFIKGSRFGWFPAISAGWIVSSENFMKHVSVLDFLKLRISIGRVGNQNVGGTRFAYRQLYTTYGGWNVGPSNASTGSGYIEADLGNRFLTWEKGDKLDVGIDANLFGHLNLSVTYFKEKRSDILNSAASITPNFLGANFSHINLGTVKAHGWEGLISYVKHHRNWGYEAFFNAAFQKNEVSSSEMQIDEFTNLEMETSGLPIGQLIGATFEGFYTPEEIENGDYKTIYGKVIPGSIKASGYSAIGKDLDVPQWDLGLSLGLNIKRFYVCANFHGNIGRTINLRASAPNTVSPLFTASGATAINNISKWIRMPWTEEMAADPKTAKDIDFPSLTLSNSRINRVNSTFYLRNADFVRLRTLEVGYDFSGMGKNLSRLDGISIFIRATNLLTITNLDYFDPEVQEGYPLMKSYIAGVSYKF